MGHGSGLTRGDRRRNERLARLRGLVPRSNAILAVDLGELRQVSALADHDTRLLGRRVVTGQVWSLGEVLDWAVAGARAEGFASVTVACEPTGHRWRTLMALADERGLPFVCTQSLAVHREREAEDYTWGKTDHKDTALIARLVARLDCYVPERADALWARLRHLGARRSRLLVDASRCRLQLRDLLGCVWPGSLEAAAQPWESRNWLACLAVTVEGCGGDPARVRRGGYQRFVAAVRRELPRWGGVRPHGRILGNFWRALADPRGVAAQRPGALERAHLVLDDWADTRRKLADVEARMVAVLDDLDVGAIVSSIPGLSAVAGAAILAETGDPDRFTHASAVVKHAGLNPCENTSGAFRGETRISHRGRSDLRTAAWRAAWAVLRHNPVLAAKFEQLTEREENRLSTGQAHTACAATLLRWLHGTVTSRTTWDADIAAGRRRPVCLPAAA